MLWPFGIYPSSSSLRCFCSLPVQGSPVARATVVKRFPLNAKTDRSSPSLYIRHGTCSFRATSIFHSPPLYLAHPECPSTLGLSRSFGISVFIRYVTQSLQFQPETYVCLVWSAMGPGAQHLAHNASRGKNSKLPSARLFNFKAAP